MPAAEMRDPKDHVSMRILRSSSGAPDHGNSRNRGLYVPFVYVVFGAVEMGSMLEYSAEQCGPLFPKAQTDELHVASGYTTRLLRSICSYFLGFGPAIILPLSPKLYTCFLGIAQQPSIRAWKGLPYRGARLQKTFMEPEKARMLKRAPVIIERTITCKGPLFGLHVWSVCVIIPYLQVAKPSPL